MRLLRRLRYLLHRERRERELAAELAFHRTLAEEEQRNAGLDPELAKREAALQMGNTTLAREDAHHVWCPAALEGLLQDLRYACRGLVRSKVLLAVACLSLGLSTGFGTALFSVVNAVILQPVTAKRPDALVRVWVGDGNRTSLLNLQDLCNDTPAVSCSGYRVEELEWQQGEQPVRLFAQEVSPSYFQMLGIDVARGRVFTPATARETPDTVNVPGAHRCASFRVRLTGWSGVREARLPGHPR